MKLLPFARNTVTVLVLAGCGPSTESKLSLVIDGSTINYVPETKDGEPLGLIFDPDIGNYNAENQVQAYTQKWTTADIEGARSEVTMIYDGAAHAVIGGVLAIDNSALRFYDRDGGELAGPEFRVDYLIPTGNAEQPVLYASALGTDTGHVSFGPWCGEGDQHSAVGCGFPLPEGIESAELSWPGIELIPWTDGCSGTPSIAQLAPGDWKWDGDTLTVTNGQEFDCVTTPMNEVVCTDSWIHPDDYGDDPNEGGCPYEVNAVIWPDIAGTAAVPYQPSAYWHVKAKERLAFDIADQCLAYDAACITYQ